MTIVIVIIHELAPCWGISCNFVISVES